MTARYEVQVKRLLDQLESGRSRMTSDGGFVSEGYKPDRAYRRNNLTRVLELESSTSRKGFIGGYLKAQEYFQNYCGGKGRLVFIINRNKKNLYPIGDQLSLYHEWLRENGIHVQPTYLMYDEPLGSLTRERVEVLSGRFLSHVRYRIS